MSKCTNPCYMTHRVLKARMNYCISQNPSKKKPPSQTPKPPNATSCPPLVFKGFKIQTPINFTMRPSHVQGKIHLQKLPCFFEIWPYDDENFFLSSCPARSRLWRSSKCLWFKEEETLMAPGNAVQKTQVQSKQNTNPNQHQVRGEKVKYRSRTPHRNRTTQASFFRVVISFRSNASIFMQKRDRVSVDQLQFKPSKFWGQLERKSITTVPAWVIPHIDLLFSPLNLLVCHTKATLFSCQRIHSHDVASAYSKWKK